MAHKIVYINEELMAEIAEISPTTQEALSQIFDNDLPQNYFSELEEVVMAQHFIENQTLKNNVPSTYFDTLEDKVLVRSVTTKESNKPWYVLNKSWLRAAAIFVFFTSAIVIYKTILDQTDTSSQQLALQENMNSFISQLDDQEVASILNDYTSREDVGILIQSGIVEDINFDDLDNEMYDGANNSILQDILSKEQEVLFN